MRRIIPVLCLLPLVSAALTQPPAQTQNVPVQVRTLTIVSKDLPQAERAQIVHALQGKTLLPEQLAERVRLKLYDLGYARAIVNPPQLSAFQLSTSRAADVLIVVNPGGKYRLDTIRFENAQAFSVDQLRNQFPIASHDIFTASAIAKGLDNLRNLYGSKGYINCGVIPKPQYDEAHHAVALTIDIDEGKQWFFGDLLFDGVEPRAGAKQALLAEWKQLQGKPYDWRAMLKWLGANASFLPDVQVASENYTAAHFDDENRRIDIELKFP